MKTTNTRAHFTGIVRPLTISVLAALSTTSVHAADKLAQTPFYLQNKTTTGSIAIKPNVMLFIDDSGSMNSALGSDRPDRPASPPERSKLQITKDALNALLEQYQDTMNWSLQTLHNNGDSDTRTYTDGTSGNTWKDMQSNIKRIAANQGTPTTRRYYEISKLVRDQTKYRCQKNYIVLMSDGDANMSCGYNPQFNYPYTQNDIAYFGNRPFPQFNCFFANPSNVYAHPYWDRDDGLRFFSHTLAQKDFKTSGTDAANKSWDGDPADPKESDGTSIYKKQTAETFTVGFGSGISEAGEAYLKKGASSDNGYFTADDETGLVSAFSKIFSNIEAGATVNPLAAHGAVAPAIMSSNVPNMAAVVHLDTASWSSQLRFFNLDAQGNVTSNNYKQPNFKNRRILINTGSRVAWADSISDLNNDTFAIPSNTANSNTDEWKNALLPWTIRSTPDTEIKQIAATQNYSQTYRERTTSPDHRTLGDIIDSPVSAIGRQIGGRQEFLVTAANDGMVHLFRSDDNSTAENPYHLKLSYIPAGMERDAGNGGETLGKTLKELAQEGYGQSATQPHRYMVNGGFVLRQTPDNSHSKGQQIFMAGAMGQGGRGAYALNIGGKNRSNGNGLALSGSNMLREVPLFETPKGAGNTLGYTIGTPQIGRVSINRPIDTIDYSKDIRYATFLASGYRSRGATIDNNETALYIYETLGQEAQNGSSDGIASPGTLIRKIVVPNGVGGLSSPTLVDTDFDGVIDVAYAGDYGGNMYRFDFRSPSITDTNQTNSNTTPDQWQVSRIYQGNSSQPITSAPAISRRARDQYVVIFGTGSDIYENDREDKNQQAIYGIFDNVAQAADIANATDLQAQTITNRQSGDNEYRFLSNNPVMKTQKGWQVLLPDSGERVVVKPTMILRTAIITTRSYNTAKTSTASGGDVCIPDITTTSTSSSSWLMGLNAETGGALSSKKDAYLDFKVVQTDSSGNASYYANGLKSQGIISFSYTDTNRIQANGSLDDSSRTIDGDSGGAAQTQNSKIQIQ